MLIINLSDCIFYLMSSFYSGNFCFIYLLTMIFHFLVFDGTCSSEPRLFDINFFFHEKTSFKLRGIQIQIINTQRL